MVPTTTQDAKIMLIRVLQEGCGCGGCQHMRAGVLAVLGAMDDPTYMATLIAAAEKSGDQVRQKMETASTRHELVQRAVNEAWDRAMGKLADEPPEPEKKVTH